MSDLISRQAAMDALQKEINKGIPPFNDVFGSIRAGVRLARNIIEDLPSAQSRWIPASERLPDREGRYLVTLPLVNGYPWLKILHYGMPDFDEEYRRRCWYETGDYCDIAVDGIVAWMPLPEPYEERREDV